MCWSCYASSLRRRSADTTERRDDVTVTSMCGCSQHSVSNDEQMCVTVRIEAESEDLRFKVKTGFKKSLQIYFIF